MDFYMRKRGRKNSSAHKAGSITRMGLADRPGASLQPINDRCCGFTSPDITCSTESDIPFDFAELKNSKL